MRLPHQAHRPWRGRRDVVTELPAMKELAKHLGRSFVTCILLWNPLIGAGFTVLFGGLREFLPRFLVGQLIAAPVTVQCFAFSAFVRAVDVGLSRWRGRTPKRRKAGWYVAASTLFAPAALLGAFRVADAVMRWLGRAWTPPDADNYRVAAGLSLLMGMIFVAYYQRADAREAALEAQRCVADLEHRRVRAELAALTAEMNPHLLFNALNTVASLVHGDPDAAEDTVVELAEMYRGVLRSRGRATHPLADELRLCEAYLNVERARFGDRLRVTIEVDPDIDPREIEVPVLLIQPFVENAVKHGISPRKAGGNVTVVARRRDEIVHVDIEDDGVGLGSSPVKGSGVAIANCRERLALAYGSGAALDVAPRPRGGTRVRVSLPPGEGGRVGGVVATPVTDS
jgi:two-component sensor histidine kinase